MKKLFIQEASFWHPCNDHLKENRNFWASKISCLEGHREASLMPKPCTQKPHTKEDSETLIFASWREVIEGYYFSNKKPTEKVSWLCIKCCALIHRNFLKGLHDSAANAMPASTANFYLLLNQLHTSMHLWIPKWRPHLPLWFSDYQKINLQQVQYFWIFSTMHLSVCSKQCKCGISGYFQECIYLFATQFLKGTEEKGRNQSGGLHYLLPKIAQQKVWAFRFRQRITPTSTKFFPPSRSRNKYHHMV